MFVGLANELAGVRQDITCLCLAASDRRELRQHSRNMEMMGGPKMAASPVMEAEEAD